jgi:protein O-mannosyl-transferase
MKTAPKPIQKRAPGKPAAASPQAPLPQPPLPRPSLFHPRSRLLAFPALVLVTWLAFSNSFGTGFALDNHMLILRDTRIQQASVDNVNLILRHTYWWPNGESGLYRPLTTLSYMWNYAVLGNGSQAAGYHWVNFGLHAANVLMVFALALLLLAGSARRFSLACAIAGLWAVHPVLTESVTNIAGRADLLAGAAVLAGFLFYLKSAAAAGWRRIPWLVGLSLAALIGVFSKESAVVLPAIIVLYELLCRGRGKAFPWVTVVAASAAMAAPIAVMLWQRSIVLAAAPPAEFPFVDNPIAGAGFWIGRLTALKVLARYLAAAFFPLHLCADYSYSEIPLASGSLGDWVSWLAVAAAIAVLVVLYRRNRTACFFVCFAFLNLLPASNLLFPIGTIMAERLLYLPLIGLLAAAVMAADEAARQFHVSGAALAAVACLVAGLFAFRAWTRNQDWTDDLSMARASVRSSPNSFKTHRLLAVMLDENDPNHANIDQVLAELDRSTGILATLPDRLDVAAPWRLAAAFRLAKGDLLAGDAARAQYQTAARVARRAIAVETALLADYDQRHSIQLPVPKDAAEGYRILASAYLRLRQPADAMDPAVEARKIDPANAEAYTQIADAWLAQQRGEDAAITLAEGMFAAHDGSLRADLLKLYQAGLDTRGCAVVPGPRGPALNPGCEMVHRHLCAGALRAGRQDLAQQLQCGAK